jgi:hypothetical protein
MSVARGRTVSGEGRASGGKQRRGDQRRSKLREELETLKQRQEQLEKLLSVKEANSTQDEASSVAKSEDRTWPEAAPAGGVSPRLVDDAVLATRPIWSMIRTRWRSA